MDGWVDGLILAWKEGEVASRLGDVVDDFMDFLE